MSDRPSDRELIEAVLKQEGSTGETYQRFYRYSLRNLGMLALNGCPMEPIGTWNKWKELGRWVKKGSKAFPILRPILVRGKDEEGDEADKVFTRFKVVNAIFPYSMTEGDELPPYEPPDWSTERLLANLAITQVAFESYEGNMGGYAVGRTLAINPVAPNSLRTFTHEASHIQLGHTEPESLEEYRLHRGVREAEAETSAHLVLKEIGALDEETRSVSVGYIRGWLGDGTLPDSSISRIISVADQIIKAGREAPDGAESAAS